jgi:hypothetical protein
MTKQQLFNKLTSNPTGISSVQLFREQDENNPELFVGGYIEYNMLKQLLTITDDSIKETIKSTKLATPELLMAKLEKVIDQYFPTVSPFEIVHKEFAHIEDNACPSVY